MEQVKTRANSTPFFSQWESRDITSDVLARGAALALAEDLNWASSGAATIDEYVQWAGNLCAMACLKMILAARTGCIFPRCCKLSLCHLCAAASADASDRRGHCS